jgi:hypothetical protein
MAPIAAALSQLKLLTEASHNCACGWCPLSQGLSFPLCIASITVHSPVALPCAGEADMMFVPPVMCAGKSSLLRILGGLWPLPSGRLALPCADGAAPNRQVAAVHCNRMPVTNGGCKGACRIELQMEVDWHWMIGSGLSFQGVPSADAVAAAWLRCRTSSTCPRSRTRPSARCGTRSSTPCPCSRRPRRPRARLR